MSGQTCARMIEAMKLVLDGVVPYTAAQRAGVRHESLYRCKWYKMHRDSGGDPAVIAQIRKEMDVTRPVPRKNIKKAKFSNSKN